MSGERPQIKAGTLVSYEAGAYSDYSILGFFLVLRDIVPHDELDRYRAQAEDQQNEYAFLSWLVAQGYLLQIPYTTIYAGAYGLDDRDPDGGGGFEVRSGPQ